MSEVKFSEGPWSTYGDWGVKSFGKRDCFVTVEDQGEGPNATAEKFANMNLVAAAPEMYEMLEECSILLRDGTQEHAEECAKKVQTLLAKARGE